MDRSKSSTLLALIATCASARGFSQVAAEPQTAPIQDSAQTPGVPTVTLHVTAKLVVLDVNVQDKQGHPILSLGREDFTILDNGVPQKIRSFEPPSAHVLAKTADKDSLGRSALTILLFDELNTRFEDASQTRDALENYLKAQPAVMAQPTMLVALNDAGYQMLANYTQNPQDLLAALRAHKTSLPSTLMRTDNELRLADTFSAMRQLAIATRGVGQRKNVIWVGNGFPSVNVDMVEPRIKEKLMDAVQDLTDLLLDSRISVSKIDPRANTSATADPFDDTQDAFVEGFDPYATSLTFNNFVKQTGGQYIYGRNDIEASINEASLAGSAYYTLSYSPVSSADEKSPYHQIAVKIDRPDMVARTREGYYATTNQPELTEDQKALATLGSAASDTTSYSALAVRVAELSYSPENSTGGTVADCTLALDGSQLRWSLEDESKQGADLLVAIAAFAKDGKMLTYNVRRLNLDVDKAVLGEKAISHPAFRLYTPVPRAAVKLRFLVTQQDTGKIGTADVSVAKR